MRQIERELEKIPTRIIEHFTVSSILSNLGYTRINDKIAQLIRHKILIPIKRGLYVYMPLSNKNLLTTEIIANTLLIHLMYHLIMRCTIITPYLKEFMK